jgi:hypothetical protein
MLLDGISPSAKAVLSPRIRKELPCFFTILWTMSLSVSCRMKAAMSPLLIVFSPRGATVMTSPSLMKGDMLVPLARNLKGKPLSWTAVIISISAFLERV